MPVFNSSVRLSEIVHPVTGEIVRLGSEFYADVGRGLFAPEIFLSAFTAFKATVTGIEEVIAPVTWVADGYPWPTSDINLRIKAGGNAADDVAGAGARLVVLDTLDPSLNVHLYALPTAGASVSVSTDASNSLTGGSGLVRRINGAFVISGGTYRPSGTNVGDITIEDDSSGDVLSLITAGTGQSAQALNTVPAGHTGMAVQIDIGIDQNKPIALRGYLGFDALNTAAPFGSVIQIENRPESQGAQVINFLSALVPAPAGSDGWFTAQAVTGNSTMAFRATFINFLNPVQG